MLNLGACLGYLGAQAIMDTVGRKRVVLANTLMYLIGYITTFFSHEAHQLVVGRLILRGHYIPLFYVPDLVRQIIAMQNYIQSNSALKEMKQRLTCLFVT